MEEDMSAPMEWLDLPAGRLDQLDISSDTISNNRTLTPLSSLSLQTPLAEQKAQVAEQRPSPRSPRSATQNISLEVSARRYSNLNDC